MFAHGVIPMVIHLGPTRKLRLVWIQRTEKFTTWIFPEGCFLSTLEWSTYYVYAINCINQKSCCINLWDGNAENCPTFLIRYFHLSQILRQQMSVLSTMCSGRYHQLNKLDCSVNAHLLLGEVVFDQTAHDLLRRPGCADVRGDQTAQDTLRISDPACKHTRIQITLCTPELNVFFYSQK